MATSPASVVTLDLSKSIAQVQRDEGYRQLPYKDSRGVLTVGIGFNLDTVGFTEEECRLVLQRRLWDVYLQLLKALPWMKTLDEPRQGVLVNMAYNLGVTGLLAFGVMLQAVLSNRFEDAAADMLESRWAEQVGDRAKRLAEQMRTGVWE